EIHAGELGQAKVDDRDVERYLAAEVKAFLAVAGRVDREAITLEACRERFAQRRLVFHQQYAHRRLLEYRSSLVAGRSSAPVEKNRAETDVAIPCACGSLLLRRNLDHADLPVE